MRDDHFFRLLKNEKIKQSTIKSRLYVNANSIKIFYYNVIKFVTNIYTERIL